MLVVSDVVTVADFARWVAVESHGRVRGTIVAVGAFISFLAFETSRIGERRQDAEDVHARLVDEVIEELLGCQDLSGKRLDRPIEALLSNLIYQRQLLMPNADMQEQLTLKVSNPSFDFSVAPVWSPKGL